MEESKYNLSFQVDGKYYLYNVFTSALALLDSTNIDVTDETIAAGFYVPDDQDETQLVMDNVLSNINLPITRLDLTVVLTEKCNFGCVYCYQDKANHSVFTLCDVQNLMVKIRQAVSKGVRALNIHYFGGEPLLNTEAMIALHRELSELAGEHHISYQPFITTNGSLLTSEILRLMQFNRLQLTFDGHREWHNRLKKSQGFNYDDLLSQVSLVLQHSDTTLRLRFNVCAENAESFDATIEDILSLPAFRWDRVEFQVHDLVNHGGKALFTELTPVQFASYYWSIHKKLQSKGMKLRLPQVLTQPCEFITQRATTICPGGKTCFCTTDFSPADASDLFEHPHAPRQRSLSLPKVCMDCKVLPLCLGGCALRERGLGSCVPWKHALVPALKDYVTNPDGWVQEF